VYAAAAVVVRPVCACCWPLLGGFGPGYVALGAALARPGVDLLVLVIQDANPYDVAVLDLRVPVFLESPVSAWLIPPYMSTGCSSSAQRNCMALSGQLIHVQHGLLHRVLRIHGDCSLVNHLLPGPAHVMPHLLHGDALVR
jgi:hypothetical protein